MNSLVYCLVIVVFLGCGCVADDITADGCGKTKNCYRHPEDCDITKPECRFVSWRPAGKGSSRYKFEMSGDSGNGDRYISFALALISDMKDADMYYCDGKNFGVGSIPVRRGDPTYLPIGNDITDYSAKTVNGVAQCHFNRPASINRVISEGADHDFDVEHHKYYLLVAVGDMAGPNMTQHDWRVHLHDSFDFSIDPASASLPFKSSWSVLGIGMLIAIATRKEML